MEKKKWPLEVVFRDLRSVAIQGHPYANDGNSTQGAPIAPRQVILKSGAEFLRITIGVSVDSTDLAQAISYT